MSQNKHDKVANRIAKQQNTKYNRGAGVDVRGARRVIEVETPNTIGDAGRQLRGYQKPAYVAVTESQVIKRAVKRYEKTTIGVMGPSGKIVKRSSRGRRK